MTLVGAAFGVWVLTANAEFAGAFAGLAILAAPLVIAGVHVCRTGDETADVTPVTTM